MFVRDVLTSLCRDAVTIFVSDNSLSDADTNGNRNSEF